MIGVLRKIASLRLTLIGIVLLAIVAYVGVKNSMVDVSWTAVPLALLSINLIAALLTNRKIRTQSGLLIFHVGLLCVFALIAVSVVTRFDGHVEVLQGESFTAHDVIVEKRGWLHRGRLSDVSFRQEDIRVEYLPGLVRQNTSSTISFPDANGVQIRETIGDRRSVEFQGYRFLATFNKGLALVLSWHDASGEVDYGAVHLPSYPQFDWKQAAEWVTPTGQVLTLELELDQPLIQLHSEWILQRPAGTYKVRLSSADADLGSIGRGERIALQGGTISLQDVRLWMAYRVDYYRYLPWMFAAAMLAIGGLLIHFAGHYLSVFRPSSELRKQEAAVAHVSCI